MYTSTLSLSYVSRLFCCFEAGSCYIAYIVLEIMIILLLKLPRREFFITSPDYKIMVSARLEDWVSG